MYRGGRFNHAPSLTKKYYHILLENVLQFDAQVLTKMCYIGTKLAPAKVTLYVDNLEEAFLEGRDKKPDLWV